LPPTERCWSRMTPQGRSGASHTPATTNVLIAAESRQKAEIAFCLLPSGNALIRTAHFDGGSADPAGSSSFGSTSHPNVRWSRGLKLCRALVRDASPACVLSTRQAQGPRIRLSTTRDPPQIPAPVGAALATSQPVQQLGPIVPTDQLLFRTHWLADETLLWQRDQSNHEPKRGNGLREIENR
jgi:hypothetical protein